jgi:hypothetical protein
MCLIFIFICVCISEREREREKGECHFYGEHLFYDLYKQAKQVGVERNQWV